MASLGSDYAEIRYFIGVEACPTPTWRRGGVRFPEHRSEYGEHIGPGCYAKDEAKEADYVTPPLPSAWAKGKPGTRFEDVTPHGAVNVDPKWDMEHDEKVWHRPGLQRKWTTEGERFPASITKTPLIRGQGTRADAAFHRTYNTDCLQFQTLKTSISQCPIKYSSLRSKEQRFRESRHGNPLGPGAYDVKMSDHAFGITDNRPSPAFRGNTERFKVLEDDAPPSTYTFKRDRKTWVKRGIAFSTQARFPEPLDL